MRPQPARGREGEPRLTDAAGAGHVDESMRGGEAQDLAQFVVPADQLGNRRRQVRRRQRRCGLRRYRARAGALVRPRRQNTDLAGQLIAVSGDRADQLALRAKGGALRRNLGLQIVLLDDPVGPHARHQRVLADDGSVRLDKRHQHSKAAPAKVDRPTVGEELAAMRHDPETAELNDRSVSDVRSIAADEAISGLQASSVVERPGAEFSA